MLIRSISGLRGITGNGLTPETVVQYISAFAEWTGGGTIIVGRDGRPSGRGIEAIVVGTLASCGIEVVQLGMVPTPTVQMATETSEASGGISITASHNPEEWNGLKFLNSDGVFLGPEECAELFEIVDRKGRNYPDHTGTGTIIDRSSEGGKDHIEATLRLPFIDHDALAHRSFRVVVDAVNASGSFIIPDLLEALGCEVIRLYCNGTGRFPHTPEPLPQNLTELCLDVPKYQADLGIAVDPDGDRLVLIDERGMPIGEEYSITLAADFMLGEAVGRGLEPVVAVNLSTTRAVDDVAARHGGRVVRTPVGEINVVKGMKESGAIIGGEGSGGIILPELHYGRDSLAGTAIVLQHLLNQGKPLSEVRAALPNYVIVKRKIELKKDDPDGQKLFAEYRERYHDNGRTNDEDGLRIDFDQSWIHLRSSNTEPIIRIIAEGPTREEAERLVGG